MQSGLRVIFDTASIYLSINRIANVETDEGTHATYLRNHVEQVARTICQEFDFPSCRARYKLVKDTSIVDIPPPFTGVFPLPSNYLRLLDFHCQAGDYEVNIDDINNRRIMYANFEPGWIIYSRMPPYDLMDPLLLEAIGCALAARLSLKISESEAKAQENERRALAAFSRAVSATSFERSADRDNGSIWLEKMRGY